MSAPTRAVWRFALGHLVRWAGDGEVYTITLRRWVERPHLPPYAEYALDGLGTWEVEADLEALDERETPASGGTPGPTHPHQ